MELIWVFRNQENARIGRYNSSLTTDQIDYIDQLLRTTRRNGLWRIIFRFRAYDNCYTNPAWAFYEILKASGKNFSMYIGGDKINVENLCRPSQTGIVKFVVGRKVYNQLLM